MTTRPRSAPGGATPVDGAQNGLSAAFERLGRLLEFPVDFPVKVLGTRVDGFAQAIAELVRSQVPGFDPAGITLRASSKGTYLSLSFSVRVESREQLERLYRALATHPLVSIVL